MATKRGTRRAFWLAHLRRWEAQGGTLAAYAKANNLSVQGLYAARSNYAKSTEANPPSSLTLLPVRVGAHGSCHDDSSQAVQLSLENGIRVQVPPGLTMEQWQPVLALCGVRQ